MSALDVEDPVSADEVEETALDEPSRKRRPWRRTRLWRFIQVTHRWTALLTGVVLLVIVISGVAVVLDPEIDKALNPSLYRSTATETPITAAEALAVVRRERPDFKANDVIWNRGHWEVYGDDYLVQAHVDPGTGRFNGIGAHDGGVMGFLKNLHMCALACEGMPGHLAFLEAKTPLLGNEELTVGGLIVGGSGLVLIVLCLGGLVLWWPGIKSFARGLKVRRGKGRYATHYDLHNVVGFVSIPFLLMWAITGAGFEFKQFEQAWYALLPGKVPTETEPLESKPLAGRAIDMGQAREIAQRKLPDYRFVSVSVPDAKEKTSAYSVWFVPRNGIDPTAHALWPGTTEVAVDRYSGAAKITYGSPDRPLTHQLWQDWQFYGHAGYFMGAWPRLLWVVIGLAPLLLAVTGVTTWLIRRRKRRGKRRRVAVAT